MSVWKRQLPAAGFLFFLTACTGGRANLIYRAPQADIPYMVAVLPAANQSTDLAAPDTMKRVDSELLLELGMLPVAGLAQDKQLREKLGITDGGQLGAVKPNQIAEALGVDGLLYTTIEEFNEINLGLYMKKSVQAKLKLVDAQGQSLWEVEANAFSQDATITPTGIAMAAAKGLANQVVGQQFEKMLKVHLLEEAQKMAGKMRQELPDWPKSDLAGDNGAAAPSDSKRSGGESRFSKARKKSSF